MLATYPIHTTPPHPHHAHAEKKKRKKRRSEEVRDQARPSHALPVSPRHPACSILYIYRATDRQTTPKGTLRKPQSAIKRHKVSNIRMEERQPLKITIHEDCVYVDGNTVTYPFSVEEEPYTPPKKKKRKWRKGTPKDIRIAAMERDGNACTCCGSTYDLQVHHKIHRAQGGTDELDNLTTLCIVCHYEEHKGEPIANLMKKRLPKT